jgi:hypothetical protein
MNCPNLRNPKVMDDFNSALERMGGKALEDIHITNREVYKTDLSESQASAYYRAYKYWSEHNGDINLIHEKLDVFEKKTKPERPAITFEDARFKTESEAKKAYENEGYKDLNETYEEFLRRARCK